MAAPGMVAAGGLRLLQHLRRAVERQDMAVGKALQQRAAEQPLAGAQLDQQATRRGLRNEVSDDPDLALAVRHEITPVVQKAARMVLVPMCRAVRLRHDRIHPFFAQREPDPTGCREARLKFG
ncbi:MAG: hypothetical protein E5Y89_20720 [Mesorhizobium sp.]|nr:MAG: hypothetical protein E5Y89_20720 [Mesorhizobium sp.]